MRHFFSMFGMSNIKGKRKTLLFFIFGLHLWFLWDPAPPEQWLVSAKVTGAGPFKVKPHLDDSCFPSLSRQFGIWKPGVKSCVLWWMHESITHTHCSVCVCVVTGSPVTLVKGAGASSPQDIWRRSKLPDTVRPHVLTWWRDIHLLRNSITWTPMMSDAQLREEASDTKDVTKYWTLISCRVSVSRFNHSEFKLHEPIVFTDCPVLIAHLLVQFQFG